MLAHAQVNTHVLPWCLPLYSPLLKHAQGPSSAAANFNQTQPAHLQTQANTKLLYNYNSKSHPQTTNFTAPHTRWVSCGQNTSAAAMRVSLQIFVLRDIQAVHVANNIQAVVSSSTSAAFAGRPGDSAAAASLASARRPNNSRCYDS